MPPLLRRGCRVAFFRLSVAGFTRPEVTPKIPDTSEKSTGKFRSRAGFVAKIAVSVALIVYLLQEVDPQEIADRVAQADAMLLVVAMAVMALQPVFLGLRWFFVMRSIGPELPLRASIPITYIGFLFGQVLPASVGSDAARGWFAYRHGIGLREAVASLLVDRVFGLLALALLILVTSPIVFRLATPEVALGAMLGAAFIVVSVLIAIFLSRLPRGLITQPRALVTVFDTFRMVRASFWSADAASALAVSFCIHLTYILVALLIAYSLDVRISYPECVAVVAIVTFLTNLPVSFNGWGVREGAMVIGMGYLGVGAEDALTISILQGIGFALSVLPGLPIWWINKSRKTDPAAEDRPQP